MKPEFMVEKNGRRFVLYAGLLDLAHERGLKLINTTLVQIPSELNGGVAIVHATVVIRVAVDTPGEGGLAQRTHVDQTFTGLGDAAPDNVSRMMVPHLIRMAETRAKARALRDAVNVGVTAMEELGDDEPSGFSPPTGRHGAEDFDDREPPPANVRTLEPRSGSGGAPRPGAAPATPKQLQTIQRMARVAGKNIPAENLTRAQASEIISSLIGEMEQRG